MNCCCGRQPFELLLLRGARPHREESPWFAFSGAENRKIPPARGNGARNGLPTGRERKVEPDTGRGR